MCNSERGKKKINKTMNLFFLVRDVFIHMGQSYLKLGRSTLSYFVQKFNYEKEV